MKQQKEDFLSVQSRPQKILLHIARKDGNWVGKATSFSTKEEYTFQSLTDLFRWLDRLQVK